MVGAEDADADVVAMILKDDDAEIGAEDVDADVVIVILKDDDVEIGVAETQSTWPIERSQFVSRAGLRAKSSAAVIPNSLETRKQESPDTTV